MNSLKNFATKHGLLLVPIRYKHQFGYFKRKGFDLVNPDSREIIASFEPCDYSNGEKWHLRNVHIGYTGTRYLKRITGKFLETSVKPNASSFIHLKN